MSPGPGPRKPLSKTTEWLRASRLLAGRILVGRFAVAACRGPTEPFSCSPPTLSASSEVRRQKRPFGSGEEMGRKLFVGNLPFSTDERRLEELFAAIGPVDTVNIVRDQMTGRARGFAFVEMQTDEAAQTAIQRLNDTELDGRKIAVNEARPKPSGGGGGGRGPGGGGGGGGPRGGGGRGGGAGKKRKSKKKNAPAGARRSRKSSSRRRRAVWS